VAMLSACGSEDGSGLSSSNQHVVASTDSAIAAALYYDDRIPDDFYQEQLPDDGHYTVSHLRNVDLLPAVGRPAVMSYDLSTEDFSKVVDWSERAAFYSGNTGQLVDNRDTRLYHEVSRVDPANPMVTKRHRVYRSSMLDRDGIDDHYRGRIALPAMTAADVKQVIEYQWTFTMENNYGTAVLSSQTSESATAFTHTMIKARLIMATDKACDRVEVYEVSYEVPRSTGNIWKQSTLQRVFHAERDGQQINICG